MRFDVQYGLSATTKRAAVLYLLIRTAFRSSLRGDLGPWSRLESGRSLTYAAPMNVKRETKTAKPGAVTVEAPVRYLDRAAFRAAKKRVFAKHAPLLAKLAK